jgi:hypothetical protein
VFSAWQTSSLLPSFLGGKEGETVWSVLLLATAAVVFSLLLFSCFSRARSDE